MTLGKERIFKKFGGEKKVETTNLMGKARSQFNFDVIKGSAPKYEHMNLAKMG